MADALADGAEVGDDTPGDVTSDAPGTTDAVGDGGVTMLLMGLGGDAGYGTGALPPCDDCSSPAVNLTPVFPMGVALGGIRRALYVNNNGNITLSEPNSGYTPMPFPAFGFAMIAPWWADVDTTWGGAPGRNAVYWTVDSGRIVVTWLAVDYHGERGDGGADDLANTFQVIFTPAPTAPTDFDVEFRYLRCQWTTGSNNTSHGDGGLGGVPAQAGINVGDGHAVSLPGSGTASVLDLCMTSNVGTPGTWRFHVRSGVPAGP